MKPRQFSLCVPNTTCPKSTFRLSDRVLFMVLVFIGVLRTELFRVSESYFFTVGYFAVMKNFFMCGLLVYIFYSLGVCLCNSVICHYLGSEQITKVSTVFITCSLSYCHYSMCLLQNFRELVKLLPTLECGYAIIFIYNKILLKYLALNSKYFITFCDITLSKDIVRPACKTSHLPFTYLNYSNILYILIYKND